jgi:hypothetical protein
VKTAAPIFRSSQDRISKQRGEANGQRYADSVDSRSIGSGGLVYHHLAPQAKDRGVVASAQKGLGDISMNDVPEGGNGRRMLNNAQAQNGHVYIYNKTR